MGALQGIFGLEFLHGVAGSVWSGNAWALQPRRKVSAGILMQVFLLERPDTGLTHSPNRMIFNSLQLLKTSSGFS